jgi:hypothetical protein
MTAVKIYVSLAEIRTHYMNFTSLESSRHNKTVQLHNLCVFTHYLRNYGKAEGQRNRRAGHWVLTAAILSPMVTQQTRLFRKEFGQNDGCSMIYKLTVTQLRDGTPYLQLSVS